MEVTAYQRALAMPLAIALATGAAQAAPDEPPPSTEPRPLTLAIIEEQPDGILGKGELVTVTVEAPGAPYVFVGAPILQPVEPILAGQDAQLLDMQPRTPLATLEDRTTGQVIFVFRDTARVTITLEGMVDAARVHQHAPTHLITSAETYSREGKLLDRAEYILYNTVAMHQHFLPLAQR